MLKLIELIKKDLTVDWRQQNPVSGILLYLASTIFTSYMAFKGLITIEVWNALFWIIILFTAITAISRSFVQEERRSIYYFFLAKPHILIIAKLIYSLAYLLVLAILALFLFAIFFGNPVNDYPLFSLNLILGCIGLSSAFTMISAISFKSNNRSIMMAILGFPVIIPVLILAISNSAKILNQTIWSQIQGNMLTMISVDVIIIALTFILFPFTWRS